MAEHGHLKISRKAYKDDPFWNEDRVFSRWEAWEDILQRAAYRSHRRVRSGTVLELGRGDVILPVRKCATRWKWGEKKVRVFLDLLQKMDRIEPLKTTRFGQIYRILNFDTYQRGTTPKGTPEGTPGGTRASAPLRDAVTPRGTQGGTDKGTQKGTDGARTGHARGTHGAQVIEGRDVSSSESKEEVESARAEESTAPADSPPPDAIAEMQKLVDTAAGEVDAKTDRVRMIGELRMIVSGDDVTAWQDSTGNRVPWTDRPRLLRLALQRWWLDREQYPNPRSALRYVVAQQYDPHQLPKGNAPSPGSEAAKYDRKTEPQHYQAHQSNGSGRNGGMVKADGSRPPEKEDQGKAAQEWAATHPDDFDRIRREVLQDRGLDDKNSLERMEAFGLALKRVREEILT